MKRLFIFIISLWIYISSGLNIYADTIYTVKRGDTLWKIALHFGTGLRRIIQHNPQISDPNIIFPGQIITIPGASRKDNITSLSSHEKDLLELMNRKRQDHGLKPLILDLSLAKAAREKSNDMMEYQYVSHISPSYGDSINMLKTFRIPFNKVKESIGAGYGSPEEIFSLWMNSTENQSNMLDNLSTHIGIGYVTGGLHGHYWTILIIQRNEGGS
ncbi:LysM peptidoglycan-binding domain-containing protein [Bacillus sp. S/N-304-OC-R1]|uniref:LysM peptidoglycan-binding domain-containing protein n=1 Tax=Bacillus sp. S/N-304-OC-R1 TaxID=2758034 RepID=UPI001C8E9ADB|nr:LysM peptidoglycan-binding domain-containing protein [Bacillus sp. S/N-304-OC-R1]MBY0120829.1 LysM peptidoglycan-binding domain-containing protein [Bacillus sp. S/N-304-OC-R1]